MKDTDINTRTVLDGNRNSSANEDTTIRFPEPDKSPYYYVALNTNWIKVNKRWSVRMAEVLSDGRCPTMVVCEVAGRATVKIELQFTDGNETEKWFETLTVEGVNRFPMPDGALKPTLLKTAVVSPPNYKTQSGIKITLCDLRPYPRKEFPRDIPAIPYKGLLLITEGD